MQQLACYLWDNFLQLYETDEIFLLGVGNAYLAVKVLLINRGKAILLFFLPLFSVDRLSSGLRALVDDGS